MPIIKLDKGNCFKVSLIWISNGAFVTMQLDIALLLIQLPMYFIDRFKAR